MTYHDNEVYFSVSEDYSIIGGSYTVDTFAVTPGQDPNGDIHAGLTVNFGSNGQASFHVGRKGASSTASWFNAKVANWQTTFNDSPKELNFAFSGTLKLTLTGGILSYGQDTFTFSDIFIAQGHTSSSNNWWFGGPGCSYSNNHQVTSEGTNSKGDAIFFTFNRGGNDAVNNILATPTILIDTSIWMRMLDDDLRLDEMMMPGSHDAGMSELSHCAPPEYNFSMTQAQQLSIGDQLLSGSRYFDIRVDFDYGQLVTYHRTSIFGCNGQDLKSVLDETAYFLDGHPSETVVFKFSDIRDNLTGPSMATIKAAIDALLNQYDFILYKDPTVNLNLARVSIGRLRGKMIAVFDYPEYINPAEGRFLYGDGNMAQSTINLTVFDQYSNTSYYDTMEADQLQKWDQNANPGQGYLFLLSWTLTPFYLPESVGIQALSTIANGALPGVLYTRLKTGRALKPNIVYVDYINPATTQSIIMYNF